MKVLARANKLAVRIEGFGSGTLVKDTEISGRLLRFKISGYLYLGCGGNVGGEGDVGGGLPGGFADVMAEGVVADGLAKADGVAFEEDLEDVGVDDLEDFVDGEGMEDLGVDLESSSSSEHCEREILPKRELSLTPATHSQSTVLLRSRMTMALR